MDYDYGLTGRPDFPLSEKNLLAGCMGNMLGALIVAVIMLLCCLFSGCRTHVDTSFTEHGRVEDIMERLDSVIGKKTVIQADSAWRELIMRQFQSIREKSDTSHTVVVDTAGKVIREKIIINNVRETTSETESHEREVLMHRLEVMDSTLCVMQQQISHTDSLLQAKKDTVEVPAKLNWWQRLRLWLGDVLLVVIVIAAGYGALRLYAKIHSGGVL